MCERQRDTERHVEKKQKRDTTMADVNESDVSETFQSNISCVAVVTDADASADAESPNHL